MYTIGREVHKDIMKKNLKDSFGFTDANTREFFGILENTRGYLAGGFCLAAFLEKPLLKGQDLDVWVPTPVTKNGPVIDHANVHNAYQYDAVVDKIFHLFFKSLGYTGVRTWDPKYSQLQYNQLENRFTKVVRSIMNYTHPEYPHKIQLIKTYDLTARENISTFDLNVCQFSFDAYMNLKFYSQDNCDLTEIRRGIMRENPRGKPLSKERREKYEKRGFKLVTNEMVQAPAQTREEPTSWF